MLARSGRSLIEMAESELIFVVDETPRGIAITPPRATFGACRRFISTIFDTGTAPNSRDESGRGRA
jgi:hypothetical protein